MSNIKSEFYNIKHINAEMTREYSGSWYYVKIHPISNKAILLNVVSDLIKEEPISISSSCEIVHFDGCTNLKHMIERELKNLLITIDDIFFQQHFTILIKAPEIDVITGVSVLSGQPQVYVLDPYINFDSFPDHPHINGYNPLKLPTSICYSGDYDFYNDKSEDEKIVYAFQQSTIWLLKHMLWVYLKKVKYHTPWIAEAGAEIVSEDKIFFINQYGRCLCGSSTIFQQCCLKKLFLKKFNSLLSPVVAKEMQDLWEKHNDFEHKFRNFFLGLIDKLEG